MMATEYDDDPEDDEGNELRYVGIYNGVVQFNADPDQLGRVRVRIPGLIDPASAWAWPAGTVGGGGAQRGFYDPPDVNSDVLVMFLAGNIDHPVYWSGFWALPDAGIETPGPASLANGKAASATERVKIKCYETERYLLLFDHRAAELQLTMRDKVTGDEIAIRPAGVEIVTAANFTMTAAGTASLASAGQLSLSGSRIKLNGGGAAIGRVGDQVTVTIPSGTVHVTNPIQPGPPTIPNPFPITLTGTITSGSDTVESG